MIVVLKGKADGKAKGWTVAAGNGRAVTRSRVDIDDPPCEPIGDQQGAIETHSDTGREQKRSTTANNLVQTEEWDCISLGAS